MTQRSGVLAELLDRFCAVRPGHRVLVAVDGVDGAGKSVLAAELVDLAAGGSRPVARTSIDGFHLPRAQRYASGRTPEGFYRNSYDYPAFIRAVIDPFRRGEPIIPAVWDVTADEPVPPVSLDLPADCVLLVEGIFLHRPQLRELWDASLWLEVPFDVSVPRGNQRFQGLDPDPADESNHRYVGGQRLYFTESEPWEQATWVLNNADLAHPRLR